MYVIESLTLYDVLQEATPVRSLSHSSRALGKKTRKTRTMTMTMKKTTKMKKKKFRLITFPDRFVLVINPMYGQPNTIVTVQIIITQMQHEIISSIRTTHRPPRPPRHRIIIIIIITHTHRHTSRQNEFYAMENDADRTPPLPVRVRRKVIPSKFPKLHHRNLTKQCSYHRRNYSTRAAVPRHPHRPVSMMKMKQIRSQEKRLS